MSEKKNSARLFAALDVGSFELTLKIFEISPRGIKQLEHIRHRLALGTDSYVTRKISLVKMEELFSILQEFKDVMKQYRIKDYRAYGTSALREADNTELLLDQIKNRSGIDLEILSNSEQRFLDYKAIAAIGDQFDAVIAKPTAIVDIGGGSIQLSLFDKGALVITQSLKLGVLRIHESLVSMKPRTTQIEALMDEMIDGQLSVFKKIYLKDREIKNLIIVDDYLSNRFKEAIPGVGADKMALIEAFMEFAGSIQDVNNEEMSDRLEISEESVPLLKISTGIIKRVARSFGAEALWAPGATLCDGIAYEYAEQNKLKAVNRDFEADILACASAMSHRYLGSRKRSEALETLVLAIFDGMKRVHGMGERQRLILRLSALLHDCGKFINMTNVGECSYAIIMNTEMIGLSHAEREMLASVVKFNHEEFEYYEDLSTHIDLSKEDYLTIAKLTAILRIANALDKSHKQKIRNIRVVLKDDTLCLDVDTGADILFEQERFAGRAAFFEEVYGLRPVIRRKGAL